MNNRAYHLQRAAEASHPLFSETVYPQENLKERLFDEGGSITLDFGNHYVGYVELELDYQGDHPDAPVWLQLRFGERELELHRSLEDYHGGLSRSWIQHAQIYVDVLPAVVKLPRRYAFRYLKLEILGMSHRFRLKIKSVSDAVYNVHNIFVFGNGYA